VPEPSPDEARALAAAAGIPMPEERVASFARGLARVRGFAAELRSLDLDDVPPWTPPR
jgi:Asp-tRNA(Asn)/Glu-tRNA(Gln) amidotransferase C subunit